MWPDGDQCRCGLEQSSVPAHRRLSFVRISCKEFISGIKSPRTFDDELIVFKVYSPYKSKKAVMVMVIT